MIVYGRNVAKEILKKPEKVQKIILQEGFADKEINSIIENLNLPIIYKSKREIDHLADGLHQGIILYVQDYKYADFDEKICQNKFIKLI